jgi:predicted alpha/beta superfamily hydrolase
MQSFFIWYNRTEGNDFMDVTKRTLWVDTLNRYAELYIGLPKDYDTSQDAYPVLYMHDGQNVFFEADAAYNMSWKVAKHFAEYGDLTKMIVVALSSANGTDRLDEYGPYPFTYDDKTYGGKGDIYASYLVNELKPYIDETYRTKSEAEHTAIMGASMGGYISLYIASKYPEVFQRVASLSGSFFLAKNRFINHLKASDIAGLKKVYVDTGDDEVAGGNQEDYVFSNMDIYTYLRTILPQNKLMFDVVAGGKHNEKAWSKRFPDVIKFLFS